MNIPVLLALAAVASSCSVPVKVESASGQEVQTARQDVADAGTETPAVPPLRTPTPTPKPKPTLIASAVDAVRLQQNSGATLQWISWDERGPARVTVGEDGVYRLFAQQVGADGGRLSVDGAITEIGDGYFILDGTIAISDTPDAGRLCSADREWRFEVTQGRKYYRMRTFEWCDGLTDYIDIYF